MSSPFIEKDLGALLLAVLENVGLALAVIDAEGKIVFPNKKALTMWGDYSVVQGISFVEWRSSYTFQDRHGRDIPTDKAAILGALAGQDVGPQDARVILPDGSVKWMHAIIEKFSAFGISGVLVVMADETEQVLLRRAMEQFEQTESLGQLTRGLIHDLNNMFALVSENLHLALAEEGIPQPARDQLQQMAVALQRGTGLAKRLREFRRGGEVQSQPFEINEAVNIALQLARPLFGTKIGVKLALDPDLPKIEGNLGEIEQALVNLILNALDAMPQGGELSLSTECVQRETHAKGDERPGCFVLVTVADTGVGIPENIQPRIFEPFFTTKAEKHGTGLGLPSVYRIVRHHQGEVAVHSVPGQGTKFTIYLPAGGARRRDHKEMKSA